MTIPQTKKFCLFSLGLIWFSFDEFLSLKIVWKFVSLFSKSFSSIFRSFLKFSKSFLLIFRSFSKFFSFLSSQFLNNFFRGNGDDADDVTISSNSLKLQKNVKKCCFFRKLTNRLSVSKVFWQLKTICAFGYKLIARKFVRNVS